MWIPWRRKTCPSVDAALWQDVVRELPILHGLDQTESERLKTLIAAFLAEKDFIGAHSFPVTDAMRIGIAASLCLPVLNLGLRWCKGWSTIIVYPDEFLTRHQEVDEIGVAHDIEEAKTGESWADGPL